MPSLLFEIGCEELPASACREAGRQLTERWLPTLGGSAGRVLVGPRRMALLVEDLPERTPDEWVQGPPEHLREKAAAGFARKHGISADELEVRDGFLGVVVPGRPLEEALPELLAEIVRGLSFSKSMVWEKDGLRFSRPVRWLCAKLGEQTVELDVAGIPSGGETFGHRFTHGRVKVKDAESYLEALRKAGVEPDPDERRAQIVAGLDEIGGWSDPAGVLEEVVYLVESVTVLEGTFDERFLELPPLVVQTAMQSHQRYFPLEGARFAFVANGGDPATVISGNERVLEGRLEDAHFSFERDVAKGIEALSQELGSITFAAGAGSFEDKTGPARAARRRAGRRGGLARGGPPGEGRPGLRARARVPGPRGSHRGRVRSPRRLPRGRLRCDRRAVPARLGRRAAAPDGAGARARGGREGRQPHRRVRPRPAADGLARPARPAARRDRPVPPGRRGRARHRRRRARRARPRAARRAAGGGHRRPVGRGRLRVRAPGGRARRAGRVRPRRASRVGDRPRRRRRARARPGGGRVLGGVRPCVRGLRPLEPPREQGRRGR